jgi:hypothetical protein
MSPHGFPKISQGHPPFFAFAGFPRGVHRCSKGGFWLSFLKKPQLCEV